VDDSKLMPDEERKRVSERERERDEGGIQQAVDLCDTYLRMAGRGEK